MNINATLIGQMMTFAVFVWFTYAKVWPPLSSTLDDRRRKIADGLAAAELGEKQLVDSKQLVKKQLNDARLHATKIIEDANKEASIIIDNARKQAQQEQQHLLLQGRKQLDVLTKKAKEELLLEMSGLVVMGAEKIIKRCIVAEDHQDILDELMSKITAS